MEPAAAAEETEELPRVPKSERIFNLKRHIIQIPSERIIKVPKFSTDRAESISREAGLDPASHSSYALRKACVHGNTETVKALLAEGTSDPSAWNNYALRYACMYGHAKILHMLLQDPRVDCTVCAAVFARCCSAGHSEVVRIIFECTKVNLSHETLFDGLLDAVTFNHCNIVSLFINFEKLDGLDLITLFRTPKVLENVNILQVLCSAKEVTSQTLQTSNVLNFACKYGWYESAKVLLEEFGSTLMSDKQFNGLVGAIQRGHDDIVRLLVKYGDDPARNGNKAIRVASRLGNTAVLKFLLQLPGEKKVDPGAVKSEAFRLAVKNGKLEAVKMLLDDNRVNPNALEDWAIMKAIKNSLTEVLETLLEHPRIHPNMSQALFCAMQVGDCSVLKIILNDYRTDVNAQNGFALEVGAHYGRTKAVCMLLRMNNGLKRLECGVGEAFARAIQDDHMNIAHILLTDDRLNVGADKGAALYFAALQSHYSMVKKLMSMPGALVCNNGSMALSNAASRGDTKMINLLLSSEKIDPTFDDNKAFRNAVFTNRLDVASSLYPFVAFSHKPTGDSVYFKRLEQLSKEAAVECLDSNQSVLIPTDLIQLIVQGWASTTILVQKKKKKSREVEANENVQQHQNQPIDWNE